MVVFRYFNNGSLLLIEFIEANAEGQAVKVFELYLTRPEARKFAQQIMLEANTKLKEPDKVKIEDSKPLPDV